MASSVEQLIFEIIARDPGASAAFDKFRNKVDDTSKSVDKNSAALDKNSASQKKNEQANRSLIGALAGTAIAFAPITGAAAAAGLGVGVFAATSVPSIKKISAALTGTGGLAASWNTLDNRQRNAATSIQGLGRDYSALARQMEPQVFQVFNEAVSATKTIIGPLGQLARSSGQGVSDFLVQFSQDSGLQNFIRFASGEARPAIDLLGTDITQLSHTVFALLEAFGGTGITELKLLTSGFTALDDSVSFLSQHAPGLTSAAVAIGGVALALSKLALLGPATKVLLSATGITAAAAAMEGFAGATEGATLAEKGMLATTTTLEAITPFGWAVLAVTAITGLTLWLTRFKSSSAGVITSIEAQSKATGLNTQGYLDAASALGKYAKDNEGARESVVNLHTGVAGATQTIGQMTGATTQLTDAQKQLISDARNQTSFLDTLKQKYGLTTQGATALARASGVTATQVNKGGEAMHQALTQAEAYANANLQAQRPTTELAADMQDFANKTLTATQRTTALTNALKLFFNPAVTADQDTITLKNDQVALAKALQSAGGQTGLLTQKQRDARGAFDTYINQVAQTAQDAFQATGRTSSYTKVINAALPVLEAAAGHNRTLRQEIQKLIDTEHAMRDETVHVKVLGAGHWVVTGGGGTYGNKPIPVAAEGLMVTGGTPGVDSVPILAQRGEIVVPTPMVSAGAVDHLRGRIPGFASGGVVGSYAGSLPGLDKWMISENSQTISAIASSVSSALRAATPGPSSGGGHVGWNPGAGVGQWRGDTLTALKMLGLSSGLVLDVLYQMMTESGGNPDIVNKWDSNWLAGHPSVGLMQVIQGTFDTYAGPFRNTGPFEYGVSINPLANIYSALNYGAHNGKGFGTGPGQIGSGHGYANGGWITEPILGVGRSGQRYSFGERGPELVTPASRAAGPARVVLELRGGGTEFDRFMLNWIKENALVRGGGDVQVAFGSD